MNIDAVVMLTQSNWFTELRSNRYHYATRFAKLYPVIFVQADLNKDRYYFEETTTAGITVLHVPIHYGLKQTRLIAQALNARGIVSPLLWIYNPEFFDFINTAYSAYKIYHATEDYFAADYCHGINEKDIFIKALHRVLSSVDQIICVSPGVCSSLLQQNAKLQNKTRVITNGCDYDFYAATPVALRSTSPVTLRSTSPVTLRESGGSGPPAFAEGDGNISTVFYHGNIFGRLDFDLLTQVVQALPQWQFSFAGPILPKDKKQWQAFAKQGNVTYLGVLKPEEIRAYAHQATVGLIPFRQDRNFLRESFPLKAFEYLACGLPVVSTPIDALATFGDLFLFAEDAKTMVEQLLIAEQRRKDQGFIARAQKAASAQSYDNKFRDLIQNLGIRTAPTHFKKLKILLCYEAKSLSIGAVHDHFASFSQFSNHSITTFSDTLTKTPVVDLHAFDAVILHYSLRLSVKTGAWTVTKQLRQALKSYPGLKIAFIQDEYDTTNTAIEWIQDLGIQVVFTCVPEPYIPLVYPKEKLPQVRFFNNLTGYVPESLIHYPVKPIHKRAITIGYRGRNLPFWYGDLGQEKEHIGRKMKAICQQQSIPEDIEWHASQRIYGENWLQFLSNCKATLGTESGANVFDFDGSLSETIRAHLREKPEATYDEVQALFLRGKEENIQMNQISPKVFEAICLHTALILFEGSYSNVLIPHRHYIPLKKDFSNIEAVLKKVKDDDYLAAMAQLAYEEIILSGQYSYASFIHTVDDIVSSEVGNKSAPEASKPQTVGIYWLNKTKALIRYLLFGKLLKPIKAFVYRFDFIQSRLHRIKYMLYE